MKLDEKALGQLAARVVDALFADLRDRRFLKWLFAECGEKNFIGMLEGEPLTGLDLEVQAEIREAWGGILKSHLAALPTDVERVEVLERCLDLTESLRAVGLLAKGSDLPERIRSALVDARPADRAAVLEEAAKVAEDWGAKSSGANHQSAGINIARCIRAIATTGRAEG